MARKGIDVYTAIWRMPVVEWRYTVASAEHRVKVREYHHGPGRRAFAKHLAAHFEKELRDLGVPDDQITIMREEGLGPENFNIHHKVPVHAFGTNDFSNLILMPADLHSLVHQTIDEQGVCLMKTGETRLIQLPMPEGMVWNPACSQAPKPKPDFPVPVPPIPE